MILKIIKGVWFLSLMGFMVIFMYIYASLPETVILNLEDPVITLSRNSLFYLSLTVVSLVNVLVFVIMKLYAGRNDSFSTWFFGQIIVLNLFFATTLGLINLINSSEHFDYLQLGPAIYISIGLVVAWALCWPIYVVSRKFINKEEVSAD